MEQSIISSDSHVIEVPDLWEKGMPPALQRSARPRLISTKRETRGCSVRRKFRFRRWRVFMAGQRPENREKFRKAGFSVARPGGWDPIVRQRHGAGRRFRRSALSEFGPRFVLHRRRRFQEALFRTYNDWIIDYCQKVPDRLYGIALISMYNIDHAITEMERCKKQGVVGTHDLAGARSELPFTSEHYERFWAASQDLELPVHLHILTGFGDSMHRQTSHGIETVPHRRQTRRAKLKTRCSK